MADAGPVISVLIPVYNAALYLREALDSVLAQTFTDFECWVIDDGSTDASLSIMQAFAVADARVQVISRENRGLIATLNEGIDLARGQFIARMDADDIMQPDRLAKQLAKMQQDPSIGVCGTWVTLLDERIGGHQRPGYPYPKDDARLRAFMLFQCSLVHPTVMLRRDLLLRTGLRYDPKHLHIEDYAFFLELGEHAGFATIAEALLTYRKHGGAITAQHIEHQFLAATDLHEGMLQRLGLQPDAQQLAVHRRFSSGHFTTAVEVRDIAKWLRQVEAANQACGVYDSAALCWVIDELSMQQLQRGQGAGLATLFAAVRYGLLSPRRLLNRMGGKMWLKALRQSASFF